MSISILDNILYQLEHVRPSGSGFTARCPAHGDNRNSLSIGTGDIGQVLLYCHAGCEIGDILQALDLEMRDLFPVLESRRG